MDIAGLEPSSRALLAGVLLDAAVGDPSYSLHPVRLMGRNLSWYERLLRRFGCNGYGGGIALFLLLTATWVVLPSGIVTQIYQWNRTAGFVVHVYFVYSLLALRDLIDHVWKVQRAARQSELKATREAIGRLVGRDTAMMDLPACRRAAIESLAENFVDGFVGAVFWYVLLGLPGLLLFKAVSTMDSMVGYKTPKYLRFGWCGARLDDVMNYAPARLTFLLAAATAALVPACSSVKAIRVGWSQHALLPSPNSGWSEAAVAGAIQRKLVGPIWRDGALVTDLWLGDPSDPPLATDRDYTHASRFVGACGALAAG